MKVVLGIIIMFISAILIYGRINDWKQYKAECEKKHDWTRFQDEMKRHKRLLLIYVITFIVGFLIMVVG